MKKYCALRFNHHTLNTRVLGFGEYSDCVNFIKIDDLYGELNYYHFILRTTNKVAQGYIEKDLSNIINNVAWALKSLDRYFISPSKYMEIKDHINNYLLKDVDDLINNSL